MSSCNSLGGGGKINALFRYGKHWSAEKVANIFAPTKKAQNEVADWLVESGIDATRHAYSTGTFSLILCRLDLCEGQDLVKEFDICI